MYQRIARQDHQEDRQPHYECGYIRVREHRHAILVDLTGSRRIVVALEVVCEVITNESDVA